MLGGVTDIDTRHIPAGREGEREVMLCVAGGCVGAQNKVQRVERKECDQNRMLTVKGKE